jgi:L-lactate dehydrogenase
MDKKRKVTIVGAGSVGASFAYALAQSGLADEIVLCDAFPKLAEGQALDLMQGQPFFPQANIHAGTDSDFADSDIVVVTAGSRQKPGESRIDLLKRNAGIVGDVAKRVADSGCTGNLLIVSNPVDILTKIALEASRWPRTRVIGSGTVLDTARFRFAIGRTCGVDARNVHGYILGEHGDSEFAAWSMTSVAGQRVGECCTCCATTGARCKLDRDAIEKEVREAAYRIIELKGATYYAIGLALVRITSAILRDENSILSVSVDQEGEFGIEGVCLSVPCVVGRGGVKRVISAMLAPAELAALKASGERLRDALASIRQ